MASLEVEGGGWCSGLEMASVLSNWYGYNLFNIANFIEYAEPFPKRRKLDVSSNYRGVDNQQSNGQDFDLKHRLDSVSRVRAQNVSYRPYSDLSLSRQGLGNGSQKKIQGGLIGTKKCSLHGKNGDSPDSLVKQNRGVAGGEEEVVQEGTTIDNLYPEILCLIFEKLDLQSKGRAAQVCRRWWDAAYLKSVWKGCEAKLHLRRANPTLFPSLVRRGIKKVQVLSLRKSLRELINGIPQLESLNLSGCYNLSDSALDTAFNRDIPSLKVLNLSLCKDVTDNSLGRIATHCKNLESLELGGCTKITNTGLLLISWGLKRIRSLNLRSCWQISDHGIGHLTGINSQPNTGAKTLEEISLQDCQKLTDESLKHISEGLSNIQKINLSFCVSVTDTGLKSLSRIPTLQELNLRSCDNVSDIGVGFLAEGGSSSLSHLDVSFCDRVSDSAMAHVATGLSNLRCLSLSSCQITDAGIAKVTKDLSRLHTLNIGQCTKLTDKSLEVIANQLKSLRSIDLYGCTKISSEGLKVLNKCENLKVVNLGLWHPF